MIFLDHQQFNLISYFVHMSLSQLEKYLRENPVIAPTTPQKWTVILVSGSKGNYLKRHISRIHPEKKNHF